ncbi:V-type ATP synthase subunit E [Clostridium liquoris]|uniref:V-type proton ATPase subunit E n=1 Tax=Clostridium liquoris TaxID=1289519 RepID=A0A2T0B2N6_9CLOT|nr:V-type ATP synthase subunit E family protein [Clostridium liquoris]PRR78160.1 V-type ATP synthase subunit E [Clostridium liquoris]
MTNLDNLISKIMSDANFKAEEIVKEAKNKENDIINQEVSRAEKEKNEIVKRAYIEADSRKERIISNAHLSVRNRKLEAKGEILNKVYDEALGKLNKLPQDVYLTFIKESLLSLNIQGDEDIILSNNDKYIKQQFIDEINEELKKNGRKGEIKVSPEKRDFIGGFILSKNGIEINNTFEALIFSLKDELESQIIDMIFS